MNFLRNIFEKKEFPISSYADFWRWFSANERSFHRIVRTNANIERDFFSPLSEKLGQLREGIFYLTGMLDEKTAELVLTADGKVKDLVHIEALVDAAPRIEGWKFTAHKPPMDVENVNIQMADYLFNGDNLWFYPNDDYYYPDEIDITVCHEDLTKENRSAVENGTYIFLDNYLGELNFLTTIDNLRIEGITGAKKELIPINKLKDFLVWREKEFVEKYDGTRRNIDQDNYSVIEATLENGNTLIGVINNDLLNWDAKASHPWILAVDLKYSPADDGMPDNETFHLLSEIEDRIGAKLKDYDGYLNIGRQTAKGVREIYFACRDFRKPALVMEALVSTIPGEISLSYDIYKDKYWRSFDRFIVS
jgi:hypothetical protein